MRGTGPDHHIHVTHLAAEPGFVGMAFNAAGMDDLEALSRADGASPVETIDEPGGGYRVRLTDPNGFRLETVFGQAIVDPLPVNLWIGPDHGPGHPSKPTTTHFGNRSRPAARAHPSWMEPARHGGPPSRRQPGRTP